MKVILLIDIENLGKKNQIVDVKNGHATNYLFPQKKAVPAKGKHLHKQEQTTKEEELQNLLELKDLKTLADKLKQATLYFQFKVLPNQPAPQVTQKQIIKTLFSKYQILLPKNAKFPLKKFSCGVHNIQINLGKNISTSCKLTIKTNI